MKKQLACFLLCLQLAGNTEAGQLFRLPLLLQHFHEHKRSNPGLTLGQFLAMHYAGEEGSGKEHKSLPFHDMMHSSVAAIYAPMTSPLHSTDIILHAALQYGSDKTGKLTSIFFDRIPRPPEC